MKRSVLVAAFAVCAIIALLPQAAGAQATVTHTTFSFDASGVYGHACGVESVDCTGSTQHTLTLVVNKNRVSFNHHHADQGLSCVGVDTGLVYRSTYHEGITESFDADGCSEGCTSTYEFHWGLIAPGPNNNMRIKFLGHFTANANGEVTADFGRLGVDCG